MFSSVLFDNLRLSWVVLMVLCGCWGFLIVLVVNPEIYYRSD